MQNQAKKKSTFLQDIPFISIWFIINTSKCTILQKRKRLFCKIFNNNTSKCTILQKGMVHDFSGRSSGKFREQRNVWKGSPVFPDRMFQTEIRQYHLFKPNLWYQFQALAAIFCPNNNCS